MIMDEGSNQVSHKKFTAPVAVHLMFVQHQQVLLLRRYNTGYEDGKYSVVAGHLDGGEEVIQAAIREGKEEAGVKVDERDVQVVGVMHRKAVDERIDFFVRIHRWQGEIRNLEPHKCDDLRWFPLDALPDNMIPYVKHALKLGVEPMWFCSFGWDDPQDRLI
ncbi:NUDIX hydrolase [Laceyella putida]|uniref:NUDIX domain-containing protein n=1 Tax=Laceyella putida TaxID=110101 RepID=A0ABW2RJA2_9BACL